jgi:hypothetical protein
MLDETRVGNGQLIESLRAHPFVYGHRIALRQPGARITSEHGRFYLSITPARVTEPVWFGDCKADVQLTLQRLAHVYRDPSRIATVHQYVFEFPGANASPTHFRVYADCGTGNPQPIDHSDYFGNLHPRHTLIDRLVSVDHRVPLEHHFDLRYAKPYGEFRSGSNRYALWFALERTIEGVLLPELSLWEQNHVGDITRVVTVQQPLDADTAAVSSEPTAIFGKLSRTRVQQVANGETKWVPFPGGPIGTALVECYQTVSELCMRGIR